MPAKQTRGTHVVAPIAGQKRMFTDMERDSPKNEIRTIEPKNFNTPLTCFYWHKFGNCKRSDEVCSYAHWDTKLVACSPVAIEKAGQAKAGTTAATQLFKVSQREQFVTIREKHMQTREEYISIREREINLKEEAVNARESAMEEREEAAGRARITSEEEVLKNAAYAIGEIGQDMFDVIRVGRKAAADAKRTLGRRYTEAVLIGKPQEVVDARVGALKAIDGAMGAVAGVDLGLFQAERMIIGYLHHVFGTDPDVLRYNGTEE